ncbi:NAD(P)-dependent dehydrogenase, short-chain alcohol dehydrogenase family [Curtobacterium sp. UNCCL20]|uniref:SDR family NAD(P)-dependent oxidoreductase n=1 Tax=Curtobacterium sp. UNCCL20 TaxID=1502773 RepID=UPI0008864345|nr:SDR family NAD(P)-dependent oxidoreductase [Curtobacterium sp. UNCCL20]SDQ25613.1 NAD(P)-dependent dehydrogenase, short-chain alcohol dehydrogenase family [Curtobacterium sp. UNCCL20]
MDIRDFSMDLFSLAGKRVIVTGGNSGLGQAFSLALAKAGADVFVPSVVDDDGTTRALIEAEGRRYEFLQIDLTADDAPAQIVDTCVDRLGGVDVLVNSAGICLLDEVESFDRARWDPMIAVNLTAPFALGHVVAKHFARQGSGKIINIASLFAFLGGQWSPAYAATKHGIVGFTKAYCDELARHNVQVNAIAPGYFATKITEQTRADPETNQRVLDHIPAGRWGDVADLMGATVFLASRASDYVNGHTLTVDGGYLVR